MRPRRPDPKPLDVDAVKVVTVGTALWAGALVACLPFLSALRSDGHLWWVPTAAVGFLLGLLGIWVCRRRRDRITKGLLNTDVAPGERPLAADELPPPLA